MKRVKLLLTEEQARSMRYYLETNAEGTDADTERKTEKLVEKINKALQKVRT